MNPRLAAFILTIANEDSDDELAYTPDVPPLVINNASWWCIISSM